MTAQLSRERLEALANLQSLECMALPASHAESAQMARMLLAGMDSEPFGFAHNFEPFVDGVGRISKEQNRHYGKPLYAAPPAPLTGVDDDVRNIIGLLENNEWAEHCTSTVLGSRLESEITRLVGENKSAPVAVPDEGREQFEAWVKFHLDDEHSIVTLHRANGGLNYRDPHVDLAWIAWKESRAAMLKAGPVTAVKNVV